RRRHRRPNHRVPRQERRLPEDRRPDERPGHRREALSRTEAADHCHASCRLTLSNAMAPNDAAIDADSRGFGPGMGPVSPDRGIALVDLLMATAITATLAVLVVPLTESAVMTHEARSAASYLAAGLRETRLAAVTSGRAAALVFDETADGSWTI